jgi:GNAT superfamily N-acetyltransferase
MRGVIAEVDTHLVGLAHYHIAPDSRRGATEGWLDDLFVASAWRGRGVGSRLVETVCDSVAREGGQRLLVITSPGNYAANAVYGRLGRVTRWLLYSIALSHDESH